MGRIKTKDIKSVGQELWARYPDKFGTDFESNKTDVNSMGIRLSKRVRNKLVGYITRNKKIQARSPVTYRQREPRESRDSQE